VVGHVLIGGLSRQRCWGTSVRVQLGLRGIAHLRRWCLDQLVLIGCLPCERCWGASVLVQLGLRGSAHLQRWFLVRLVLIGCLSCERCWSTVVFVQLGLQRRSVVQHGHPGLDWRVLCGRMPSELGWSPRLHMQQRVHAGSTFV